MNENGTNFELVKMEANNEDEMKFHDIGSQKMKLSKDSDRASLLDLSNKDQKDRWENTDANDDAKNLIHSSNIKKMVS